MKAPQQLLEHRGSLWEPAAADESTAAAVGSNAAAYGSTESAAVSSAAAVRSTAAAYGSTEPAAESENEHAISGRRSHGALIHVIEDRAFLDAYLGHRILGYLY